MKHVPTAILVLAIMAAPAHAELNMQEGYWETVVTISVGGGIFPVPAIKSSKCITRADPIPNSQGETMRCQVSDQRVVGNDVSWRVRCSDEKAIMEGSGKVTYAGHRFAGEMNLQLNQRESNRRVDMKYILRGERLRACDAPAR